MIHYSYAFGIEHACCFPASYHLIVVASMYTNMFRLLWIKTCDLYRNLLIGVKKTAADLLKM